MAVFGGVDALFSNRSTTFRADIPNPPNRCCCSCCGCARKPILFETAFLR